MWRLASPKSAEPVPHIASKGWKLLLNLEKPISQFQGHQAEGNFFSSEESTFCSIQAWTDGMRSSYFMQNHLLYFTDFSWKHSHGNIQKNGLQNIWHLMHHSSGHINLTIIDKLRKDAGKRLKTMHKLRKVKYSILFLFIT